MPEKIWKDRKRHLGLPISFTRYSMSEDRLFLDTGVFTLKEDEVLLYRVRDISLRRTLWQRLFRVGTVCVMSADISSPHLELKNISHSADVKEMISEKIEEAKMRRQIRTTELLGGPEDLMEIDASDHR